MRCDTRKIFALPESNACFKMVLHPVVMLAAAALRLAGSSRDLGSAKTAVPLLLQLDSDGHTVARVQSVR